MNTTVQSDDNQNEDFDLRTVLEKYLIHWQWFVFGAFLCLAVAYVYLRYVTPQYQASTTILVKDEKKGGMLSELSAFSDMGLGSALKSNVDNEIEILKSRTLVESTIKSLKLNVLLIAHGNIKSSEVYNSTPIDVDFVNKKSGFYDTPIHLELIDLSPTTFALESKIEDQERLSLIAPQKEYRY